ncbi:MAG: CmcI family methyltransferase [Candidatus Brocadiia bacterium]
MSRLSRIRNRVRRWVFGRPPPPPPLAQGPRLEVDKRYAAQLVYDIAREMDSWSYAWDEMMLMAAAFQYHRPSVVVDIGTQNGRSARIWYELSIRLGIPAEIHTIDLADPRHPQYAGKDQGEFIRGLPVVQHIGDGFTIATEILSGRPAATALVYLDDDHSYENVRRELQLVALIREGCVLVHDSFYQPEPAYDRGVYRAIEDSLPDLNVAQVIHLQIGRPGMSYLRVGKAEKRP